MKRLLALDIGDKTIGIAASDLLGLTAQGVEIIKRTSLQNDLARLDTLITEYAADTLILGYPKNMNGTEGERCEIVKEFSEVLNEHFPRLELIFWDERLSTMGAEKTLLEADLSRRKRKKVIDKMAAQWILQGYLDSNRNSLK